MIVIGVEGAAFGMGDPVTAEVEAALDGVAESVLAELAEGAAMHEKALMDDLMAKILGVAAAEGGVRVTRITVWLGALSHFTPEHFREHFDDAARGTAAEGAEVEATLDDDLDRPAGAGRRARERQRRRASPTRMAAGGAC